MIQFFSNLLEMINVFFGRIIPHNSFEYYLFQLKTHIIIIYARREPQTCPKRQFCETLLLGTVLSYKSHANNSRNNQVLVCKSSSYKKENFSNKNFHWNIFVVATVF